MRQRQRRFILFFGFFISMIVVCEKENNDNSVGSDNEAFAEDLEKADNLLSSVRQNFEDCQSFGKSYSICIDEVLEYLGGQSDLIDYKIGQDGTTIVFTHESGIEGAFLTDTKNSGDIDTINRGLKISISALSTNGLAAIFEAPDFSNLDQNVKAELEDAGFNVDLYLDGNFTPESFATIEDYSIILISAHGFLNHQNEVCFITGDRIDADSQSYKDVYLNGVGIATYEKANGNYKTICPGYFDANDISFLSQSLFFLDACHSLQTPILAEKLSDRGLTVYLGWTERVGIQCADNTTIFFFKKLTDEMTIDEIFAQGNSEIGQYGECATLGKWGEVIYADLKYYPDWQSGFKLDLAEKPVCTSNCEGKECGDDGCAGSCGECYNNTTCAEWGVCILGYDCIEILECMENSECTGTDCYTYACYDNGTEDAQIKLDIYSACLENCGLYTEDNLWKYKVCVLENCLDEYENCGGVLQFGSANCVDLGNCFEMCNSSPRSPDKLEECTDNCFHNATYQAQLKFSKFFVCTIDECTNLDYNQCVDQMCTDEYSNCVNDI